jgi:hypothetical protein
VAEHLVRAASDEDGTRICGEVGRRICAGEKVDLEVFALVAKSRSIGIEVNFTSFLMSV